MEIAKVIKLVISHGLVKKLRRILKTYKVRHQYLAKNVISFNYQPSALAECENAASVFHCYAGL